MNLAYGKNGVVGVLVPQANTTAEPEFDILLGPGVAQLTARMVSPAPAMEDRLVTYMERLGDWIGQFDDAPLGAVAFACTGSSYVVGAAREAAAVAAAEAACGCAVVTSGRAVLMALGVLGARRVAFVSPYGPGLTERSLEYWQAGGIEPACVVEAGGVAPGAFHAIYAIPPEAAVAALDRLPASGFDAVVMLGTGLPTLPAIRARPFVGGAPVLSCVLATAWATRLALAGAEASRAGLLGLIEGGAWAARLEGWVG